MKVIYEKEISNCMECPNHKVVLDPDPYDSFCSDDEAVLCMVSPVVEERHKKEGWDNRPVTVGCRPYNKSRECEIPNWCPLKKVESNVKIVVDEK